MQGLLSYLLQALFAIPLGDKLGDRLSSKCKRSEYFDLAARMIESNVQRGQLTPSSESSAFIEQVSLGRISDDREQNWVACQRQCNLLLTTYAGNLPGCATTSHSCDARCDSGRAMERISHDQYQQPGIQSYGQHQE